MPLYTYLCSKCQLSVDLFRTIDTRDNCPACFFCKQEMARGLAAPMVRPDYPGYDCPVTGKRIEGRRAHEENLKRHNCRVSEAGEMEALHRRRAQQDAALDRAVDETVESAIHNMTPRQREQLATELAAGATANVVRN